MTTEGTTRCSACGRDILQATADRRNGMCVPCHRDTQKPPEVRFADEVFARINAAVTPVTGYKAALRQLESLPRGYALCFAFQHVYSDIMNGGASQLYANSTWPLILDAEQAAQAAGVANVASVLRELVYFYHLKGRSKLVRRIPDDYFASMPPGWSKSLKQLDDEFARVESDANSVILRLCRERHDLFTET